jgi:arsenate reductase
MGILENSNIPFETVEYLKAPPTEAVLDSLLNQLKMQPEQLVRKREDAFLELESSGKLPQNRSEWIRLMIQYPILIERPIVSDGTTAVIGRPPENVLEWLNHVN